MTSLISKINELPNLFSPSLFQKQIQKEYEIRVFFLEGLFFSMAIFSQKNKKTKIDFRDYDNENSNKMIPYRISGNLEKKIIKLMKYFNLKSGSLDFIKGRDGKIYFLEINPVGQFDFVSKNCNYEIEKLIAKKIIN